MDECIENFFAQKELDLVATLDGLAAYKDAEFVIVAAPTNYDSHKNFIDTSAVEAVVRTVTEVNPFARIVIKSTVPVGFTAALRARVGNPNVLFRRSSFVSRCLCMIIFTLLVLWWVMI